MRKVVNFNLTIILVISCLFINTIKVCAEDIDVINKNILLSDTILKQEQYNYDEGQNKDGLYYDEYDNNKIYFYGGNVTNNNLVFNTLKFQILGIDSSGNIKIVYNDNDIKAKSNNYNEIINNWFYDKFNKSDTKDIITKTSVCDNLGKSLFCNDPESVDVALITLQEFNHSKINNNTFLKKEYKYYLWTTYYNHKYFYDTINDKINTTKYEEFNVYPVITLTNKTVISRGDGSINDPYIISNTIYGDSENTIKEDRKVNVELPKKIKSEDIDLLINDNNLNSITYQIKNEDNLEYSIKFIRSEMKKVKEFDLEILFNNNDDNKHINNILKEKKYKKFKVMNEGEFPSTAYTKIKVDDKFNKNDILWLYYYDEKEKSLQYIDNNLIVEDGYIDVNINKGGEYVLTSNEIKQLKEENNTIIYIIVGTSIFVLVGITTIIILSRKRKNNKNIV